MTYDNTNRGALFKNDRKEADNHPDYTGELDVDGTPYWVNGWIKTSKKGTKFMSLSVKGKSEPVARQIPGRSDDDKISF
jgi:hypothetical protein